MNTASLDILTKKFIDKLPEFLNKYNIEYKYYKGKYSMCCPVHGGNNHTACNIFVGSRAYVPNWKCFTHQCHEEWGTGIYGFVRAILSIENDDNAFSYSQTIKWLANFVNYSVQYSEGDEDYSEKLFFTKMMNTIEKKEEKSKNFDFGSLQIPSSYYIKRGFSTSVLEKYGVGLCTTTGAMNDRIVVPVHDEHGVSVGCLGRTTTRLEEGKWKNSPGFLSEYHLYNYYLAKEHIINTGWVILVEGPPDVWQLVQQGIYNCVAMFGTSLSSQQQILLERSGALNLIIATDNDKAGRDAKERIKKQCSMLFNTFGVKLEEGKDVGDTLNLKEVIKNVEKI